MFAALTSKNLSVIMKRVMIMRKFLKRFWIFIPLVLAALMFFVLPMFPDFTENVISRGLFKVITTPVGFITSLIPISLTEIVAVLAIPAVIFLIVLFIVKMKKSKSRGKTALKAGRGVCAFLSIACFMYMSCHGANFYRQPLEKAMGLDTSQKTAEQLLEVCKILANGAAEAEKEISRDENGLMKLPASVYDELTRTGNGYEKLVAEYPFLWTAVWRQKPVLLSEPWSYTGITGMFFPFFAECNVNVAQPDYLIPATAAHESAHSRGIALENECNFLAFLSCINSDYPEFRYSGYMMALTYCANELYDYDMDMWQEVRDLETAGMIADFAANNKYIYDHEGHDDPVIETIHNVSQAANDTFIQIQGVPDGDLSYGRVTELILAYYARENMV